MVRPSRRQTAWAQEEVAKAVKFAEESPQPDPAELFTHVVAEHGPRPNEESEENNG